MLAAPPAQAATFPLELSATVAAPMPIAGLTPRGGGDDPTEPCRTDYFAADSGRRSFTFAEGPDSNGCLRVTQSFSVPPGVRRVGVDFRADRVMEDSSRTINLGPSAFEQEVRLRVGQTLVAATAYFDPTQPEQRQQPVSIRFDVPDGPHEMEVEWWFANRGDAAAADDPSAGRLQAWRATVSEPMLILDGFPLAAPILREERGQFQGGSYLTGYSASVVVPPELRAAAASGSLALHLHMPSSALVDRLLTPDGNDLQDDDYDTSISGTSRLVTLPADTLARVGPGPYVIRFQGTEPVHVEPNMAVLAGMALLMPPVAIVFAARQLRRRSLDTYIRAADALEDELAPR